MIISAINDSFSFLITVFLIFLLRPIAKHFDLVDIPGGRKQHQGEVPLVGGVAMFLGFTFALLTLNISLFELRPFIAASILLIIIGILDDFHELSMRLRFVGQVMVASLIVCWGHHALQNLGGFLFAGDLYLGHAAIPFTIIAIVGIINAVNMTDGVDGLAAILTLIELSMLAVLALLDFQIIDFKIMMILVSALLAFMLFNFPVLSSRRIHVFMGDAGSMFLGLALAWFLINLSQGSHPAAKPVTMLWIMAVPLFDLVRVVLQRISKNESPFKADQNHLHHILLALGLSSLQVIFIMSGAALFFGMVGIIGSRYGISESLLFFMFLLSFVIYCVTINWITKTYKLNLKLDQKSLELNNSEDVLSC